MGDVDGELLHDAAEAAMALGSRSSGLPPPPIGSDGDDKAGAGGQSVDGSVGRSVNHDFVAPTPMVNPTAAFPRCLHRKPAPSGSSSSSLSSLSSVSSSASPASAAYWQSSQPEEMQVVGSRMSYGATDSMPIAFALDTAGTKSSSGTPNGTIIQWKCY